MQCTCAVFSSVVYPDVKYFFTSHKRQDFFKKNNVIEHKICVIYIYMCVYVCVSYMCVRTSGNIWHCQTFWQLLVRCIYLAYYLFLACPSVNCLMSVVVLYRAFLNVLREYEKLLCENRSKRVYETCTDRRNNSIPPPAQSFFIVVHISAARRCECM